MNSKSIMNAFGLTIIACSVFGFSTIARADDADKKPVPADATEYKGHHYKIYSDISDWTGAQAKCVERGGHLVVIPDGAVNGFVHKFMKKHHAVWIGAEKALNSWRWVTVTPFDYNNWCNASEDTKVKKGESTRKPSDKTMGAGEKVAIFGDWKGNEEIRGHWFAHDGNEPTEIDAYICEWDY